VIRASKKLSPLSRPNNLWGAHADRVFVSAVCPKQCYVAEGTEDNEPRRLKQSSSCVSFVIFYLDSSLAFFCFSLLHPHHSLPAQHGS
jgi:hypothetical protein